MGIISFLKRLRNRRPKYPTLSLIMTPETILVSFDMPDPERMPAQVQEQMAVDVASSAIAFTCKRNQTIAAIINALGAAGKLRHNEAWASFATHMLLDGLRAIDEDSDDDSVAEESGPVVCPSKLMIQNNNDD